MSERKQMILAYVIVIAIVIGLVVWQRLWNLNSYTKSCICVSVINSEVTFKDYNGYTYTYESQPGDDFSIGHIYTVELFDNYTNEQNDDKVIGVN